MVKPLRIVPPEIDEESRYAKTQGTEVFAGDQKVHGVVSVDIAIYPDDIVTATIKAHCWFDEMDGAEPRWKMIHPFTGEDVQVDQLVLRGGEVVDLRPELDVTNLSSTAREFRARRVPRPCK